MPLPSWLFELRFPPKQCGADYSIMLPALLCSMSEMATAFQGAWEVVLCSANA